MIGTVTSDALPSSINSMIQSGGPTSEKTDDILQIIIDSTEHPKMIGFGWLFLIVFCAILITIDQFKCSKFRRLIRRTKRTNRSYVMHGLKRNVTSLVGLTLNQIHFDPKNTSIRLLLCLMILGYFVISNYFFAFFSTSLVTINKVDRIDSLKDLEESSLTPLLLQGKQSVQTVQSIN